MEKIHLVILSIKPVMVLHDDAQWLAYLREVLEGSISILPLRMEKFLLQTSDFSIYFLFIQL